LLPLYAGIGAAGTMDMFVPVLFRLEVFSNIGGRIRNSQYKAGLGLLALEEWQESVHEYNNAFVIEIELRKVRLEIDTFWLGEVVRPPHTSVEEHAVNIWV
jgi:hypothetical protein